MDVSKVIEYTLSLILQAEAENEVTEEMIETKVVILDLAIQDSVVIIIELMTVVLVVVAVVA